MVEPSDLHHMHSHVTLLMNDYDIKLPELPELDFSRVETEWQRLRSNIPEVWKFSNDGREFKIGEEMKARGLTATHPVILIPGVISTVCGHLFEGASVIDDDCQGPGIMVYFARLSSFLSPKAMGRTQHAYTSHIQP